MCGTMVDIQCAIAEIKRGIKKIEDRKKAQSKNIGLMFASATQVAIRKEKKKKRQDENTRMWANAQRDVRPAEHRWRPLFNAAKFG